MHETRRNLLLLSGLGLVLLCKAFVFSPPPFSHLARPCQYTTRTSTLVVRSAIYDDEEEEEEEENDDRNAFLKIKDSVYGSVDSLTRTVDNIRTFPKRRRKAQIKAQKKRKQQIERVVNRVQSAKDSVYNAVNFVVDLPKVPGRTWETYVKKPLEESRRKKNEENKKRREKLERAMKLYYDTKSSFYDTIDTIADTGKATVKAVENTAAAVKTVATIVVETPEKVGKTVGKVKENIQETQRSIQSAQNTVVGAANKARDGWRELKSTYTEAVKFTQETTKKVKKMIGQEEEVPAPVVVETKVQDLTPFVDENWDTPETRARVKAESAQRGEAVIDGVLNVVLAPVNVVKDTAQKYEESKTKVRQAIEGKVGEEGVVNKVHVESSASNFDAPTVDRLVEDSQRSTRWRRNSDDFREARRKRQTVGAAKEGAAKE